MNTTQEKVLSIAQGEKKRIVRKSVNSLTEKERNNFVAAVKLLKERGRYDWYVKSHVAAFTIRPDGGYDAHSGPAFLPWHRQFLKMFEADLQNALKDLGLDSSLGLPYWDWAADQSSGKSWQDWSVWSDDFMGGNGDPNDSGNVASGPFMKGQWETIEMPNWEKGSLKRAFGADQVAKTLPTEDDVAKVMTITPYDMAPWDSTTSGFRNYLEMDLHNIVHRWTGGSMGPPSSPNDPVFFLHHCNTDRLWSKWQSIQAAHQDYRFLPREPHQALQGHNLNDPMRPWDLGSFIVTPANEEYGTTVTYESMENPYIYWSLWGVGTSYNFGKWNYTSNPPQWHDYKSSIVSVAAGNNGDLWATGQDNKLYKFDRTKQQWVEDGNNNWGLISVGVDSNNVVYGVSTDHQMGKRDPNTGKFTVVVQNPKWDLLQVAFDAEGTKWCVGTLFNIGKWDGTQFQDQPQMHRQWNSIAFDAQGKLWGISKEWKLFTWDSHYSQWNPANRPGDWDLRSIAFGVGAT